MGCLPNKFPMLSTVSVLLSVSCLVTAGPNHFIYHTRIFTVRFYHLPHRLLLAVAPMKFRIFDEKLFGLSDSQDDLYLLFMPNHALLVSNANKGQGPRLHSF